MDFSTKAQIEAETIRLLEEEFREQARKNILPFTVYTKPNYFVGWHHRLLTRALDRFARGECPRLIVTEPPRHGKSELVSRRLPAFIFGINPSAQIISAAYGADLASRLNRDVQKIIDSKEYSTLFPDTKLWGKNIKTVAHGTALRNNEIFEIVEHGGIYRSSGVGGGITGMGATHSIIDDPVKNQEEADSLTYRERVWEWYTSTLYTRLEKNGAILLTMTRWHEDDLAGRLIEQMKTDKNADQWEIINLPAIREDDPNPVDPRQPGEALWPEKYNVEVLSKIRSSVGSRVWQSLFQQRPAPMQGNIFKRGDWQFYTQLPSDLTNLTQSWDLTFTDGNNSDFVVGLLLARRGAARYVVDMVRGRMSFTESLNAIRGMTSKWPKTEAILVERAANGAAAIDTLCKTIPRVIPIVPRGSKTARAQAVSPMMEAKNVYLPDPSTCQWTHDIIEEHAAFPNASHDDIVDAMSQGLMRLNDSGFMSWMPVSMKGSSKWISS